MKNCVRKASYETDSGQVKRIPVATVAIKWWALHQAKRKRTHLLPSLRQFLPTYDWCSIHWRLRSILEWSKYNNTKPKGNETKHRMRDNATSTTRSSTMRQAKCKWRWTWSSRILVCTSICPLCSESRHRHNREWRADTDLCSTMS